MDDENPKIQHIPGAHAWFANGHDKFGQTVTAKGDSAEHARDIWQREIAERELDGPHEPRIHAADDGSIVVFTDGRHLSWLDPSESDRERITKAVGGGARLGDLSAIVPGGDLRTGKFRVPG